MKRKLVQMTALVLALLMSVSLFAGCTGKKTEDQPAEQSSTAAATSSVVENKDPYQPVDGKVYEITYLTMTNAPIGEDSVIAQKYNEVFNVKLKPVHVEASKWDDLLNIKLSSGDVPDVIPSKSMDRFLRYLHGELLQEVPMEVIRKYAPNMAEAIDRDDKNAWNACTFEGKNYGIPYLVANYLIRDAIVWRDDWLKNVGIEKLPDNLDEWEAALVKFRNEDPDKNNKKDTYGGSLTMFPAIFGAHGAMVDIWWNAYWLEKDGEIVNSAIEPGAKEALKLLSKWYSMGLIDPEFVSGENKGGYWAVSTDFVNGRIGVSAMGNAYHWQKEGDGLLDGANAAELKKISPNASYQFVNPPSGPDGTTRGMTKLPMNTGTSYVFSAKMEKDKVGKVLQMFNWPMEDFSNYLFNRYGEEGKHYTVTESGSYKTYAIAEPYKSDAAKGMLEVGYAGFFWQADVESTRKLNGAYLDSFVKMGFDKYGVEDKGYILNMPSGTQFLADLNSAMQEAYINIITGKKPIEYFDEFAANWKKNGGDQLLKEANEHYAKLKGK